ncbi:sensor histidine kinase [Schumannella soli]|uniref:histidine kinase n=1 Tax=Schumannella soli TaxID=2590779 RepID=A0A506Y5Z5_9MICO|nr:HAMP domain-containing sensor histidine kinase [Schumannella soli]TPW77435.1 HAMP domain-containing histidine kinase [Schumannella soli]
MAEATADPAPPPAGARRRRGLSLRARVTAAAAAVALVLLGGGAVGFALLLDARIVDAEHALAADQAETVADRLGDDAAGAPPGDALAGLDDDAIVQIVRDGRILAQTEEAAEQTGAPLPGGDGARVTIDDEPHVIAAEEEDGSTVLVARSIESAGEATSAAIALLLVAVPLATAVLAAIVWFVTGRALHPVDRLRAQVDAIDPSDLRARVATPGGAAELDRLTATMNALLERIDTAQTAQRRFVADASHELRSPIASLRQHAELAADYPQTTDLAQLAEVVDVESSRLNELVDALLVLARSGEQSATRREPVDLDDLVLAEASRLRALAGPEVSAEVAAARTLGDPALLARALRNLGDNARRHARGRIALSLTAERGTAVIRVDDDGAGIPPAERERVFDRFVRLDEARSRDAGGAGLGLAIVAEAARRHDGVALVAEAPSGGARLELRIPIVQ